ncbi:MAG: hypothetical protein KO464_09915 [Candidatus Methanofastidiosum sp.]|nr:hypothetical protein [Methanofastidiosum sp.]
MATRQKDFENFGITCKYTKNDGTAIHQSLNIQIEAEEKTDDKFDFKVENKTIACKGKAEFS